MSTRDDGGPAFPLSETVVMRAVDQPKYQGMTLRDYFAAKAMAATLSTFSWNPHGEDKALLDLMAKDSYCVADAMLKARQS